MGANACTPTHAHSTSNANKTLHKMRKREAQHITAHLFLSFESFRIEVFHYRCLLNNDAERVKACKPCKWSFIYDFVRPVRPVRPVRWSQRLCGCLDSTSRCRFESRRRTEAARIFAARCFQKRQEKPWKSGHVFIQQLSDSGKAEAGTHRPFKISWFSCHTVTHTNRPFIQLYQLHFPLTFRAWTFWKVSNHRNIVTDFC